MNAIIALLVAIFGAEPRVIGLSVASVADRTEVVILVDGSVTAKHMMLDDGRLVVDLSGVPQAPRMEYRELNRGGVRELRIAQFQPNVARVVIGLNARTEYQVLRESGRIRVTFPNRGGTFEPWSQNLGGTPANPVRPVAVDAAAVQRTVAPAQPAPMQPRAQEPRPQDRRISINFEARPLPEVLAIFSDLSGRTLIPAETVRGRNITADIRDMPWPDALAAILEVHGLTIREIAGGVLLVEPAGTGEARAIEDEPLVTETFPIEFVSADSIRNAIRSALTTRGQITVNTASNTLIVTDIASALQRVRETIPLLDVETPQVDIVATVAFINRTALESYGVVYDVKDSRGNQLNRLTSGGADRNGDGVITQDEETQEDLVLLGGASIAALGNANFRVASPSIELLGTLVLGRHSLVAFLEALQTVDMSDIQAKPMIRTMNHRLARIQVGEETPIRVVDAGAQGQVTASVDMRQTGVILSVTPHITGNQVLLDINAERSNVAVGPGDIGAIFQTQNAQTQVLTQDGETVVIAGLTIIEKTKARAGIPLLMDLPVIGALFRQEQTREAKRDLLILVTPHIVRK